MPPRASTRKRKQVGHASSRATVTLEYEDAPTLRTTSCNLLPSRAACQFQQGQELVLLVLDVVEERGGCFSLWGSTPDGASVLLRLDDFQPYFYIASPTRQEGSGAGIEGEGKTLDDPGNLGDLQGILSRFLPPDCRLAGVEEVHRRPIMFYRPGNPQGGKFLRLSFPPGTNVRKASASLASAMSAGRLQRFGLTWQDLEHYESDVAPLQRLLVDVPLSGGAWVRVPPSPSLHPHSPLPAQKLPPPPRGSPRQSGGAQHAQQEGGYSLVPPAARVSSCDIEAVTPWRGICCLTPDATQLADPPWTPGGGLEGGTGGSPPAAAGGAAMAAAAAAARRGDVSPLRVMTLDVLSGTGDGGDRVAVPGKDPVVSIACTVSTFEARGGGGTAAAAAAAPAAARGAPPLPTPDPSVRSRPRGGGCELSEEEADGAATAGLPSAPPPAPYAPPAAAQQPLSVVFLLSRTSPWVAGGSQGGGSPGPRTPMMPRTRGGKGGADAVAAVGKSAGAGAGDQARGGSALATQRPLRELSSGAHVEVFLREEELLLAWVAFLRAADPDVVALFQVRDTLEVLQRRMEGLGLDGGALHVSRMLRQHSKPLAVKKVTMYSAAWVKSQSRMSSTSNQETYRAEVAGRVVLDVLRHVLTGSNLASFSLVDCAQTLLGQTLEVLTPCQLSRLAGVSSSGADESSPPPSPAALASTAAGAAGGQLATSEREARALRLARYAMRRVGVVGALMERLSVVAETIEMARATGLTIPQVCYNAQMIRTWSLLLRSAQRAGYVVAGRQDATPLSEHPFLIHPVETGTVGLYRQPVAILDFASLYPSLYRAYNLCYSTLLHSEDQGRFGKDQVTVTPTGAVFVKPEIRAGILPSILAALTAARTATRAQLHETTDPAARAVLDSRQKALKVTANALYGFTGAQASPLQCVPLADSCLAYGASSCRAAIQALGEAAAGGKLGREGEGARVIYGHTDSLFVLLPNAADTATAVRVGKLASEVVTATFPPPIELKFERVCCPLILLHVNRYAGRAFEREEDAGGAGGGGALVVKGLKSTWRQAAPIVRSVLHGALVRILMRDDVRGAVEFVEGEVRRLLSGRVGLHELVMTGGLWRVTGDQVERAATGGGDGGGAAEEEIRGPHAALAVRLSRRDPGRSFVLGERLQYVLLAGHALQDDAAEDPLTAVNAGGTPDLELYWRNKLQRPLSELFATCLTQQELQSLLNGAHTRVKVEHVAGRPQQRHASFRNPLTPGKGKLGSPGGKGRQTGLTQFYRQTAKCLGCRRTLVGHRGPADLAPGLCPDCQTADGRWQGSYLSLEEELCGEEATHSAACEACRRCHSGVVAQGLLCQNGECPVLYTRLNAADRMASLGTALLRLEGC